MIRLYLQQDESALLWFAEDILLLRRHYHMIGGLQGTLPRHPQQNQYLGLPLLLDKTQVKLLRTSIEIEQNQHRIVFIPYKPLPSETEAIDRKRVYQQLHRDYFYRLLDQIQEKAQRRRSEKQPNAELQPSSVNHPLHEWMGNEIQKESRCRACFESFWTSKAVTQEDAQHFLSLETLQDHVAQFLQLKQDVRSSFLLSLQTPSTLEDVDAVDHQTLSHCGASSSQTPQDFIVRFLYNCLTEPCTVYLTSGQKFGGDYCLYPGDPVRFHALAIVHVVPYHSTPTQSICMQDLIGFGRVANIARKSALLVSWNEQERQVESFTIDWTGW